MPASQCVCLPMRVQHDMVPAHALQAAVDKAPVLSKEEQKQLRQQKDPNCESYASCGTRINPPITI